jgi:hypothetical protein
MRTALARTLPVVIVTIVALLSSGARPALAASTITVNFDTDSVAFGSSTLYLREAIMLANGDATLSQLSQEECGQVSTATWFIGTSTCTTIFPNQPPGPNSADTIVFDPSVFPEGTPTTITLNDDLPPLDTGNDTIDGSNAGVVLDGVNDSLFCVNLWSADNAVMGLDVTNCAVGIFVSSIAEDATDNLVGGTGEGQGNRLHNNNRGIVFNGTGTNENQAIGNLIGTNSAGTAAQGNTVGISVNNGAANNTVGGPTEAERNIISGNTEAGVSFSGGAGSLGPNMVIGNYIGTDIEGTQSIPNGIGVEIRGGSKNNVIGVDGAGTGALGGTARNVISGNQSGILITSGTTQSNVIAGNYIGTDATGTESVPNTIGVQLLDGATSNAIGGETAAERNVISGNIRSGIAIYDLDTTGNDIVGNYIGVDAVGEGPLGNEAYGGIEVSSAGSNVIRQNVIGANGNDISPDQFNGGIIIADSSGFEIYDNRIGVSPSNQPLGNIPFGVLLQNSSNNIVGDVNGSGNIIAHNTDVGVQVIVKGVSFALNNTIRGNSIFSNGGLGIDNVNGGNTELAPPIITGFGSVAGTACSDCTIDVYSDDEDEGRIYEGTSTADGSGNWTLNKELIGPNAAATATDADGNTSEFSTAVEVPEPVTPTPSPTPSPSSIPTPSTTPGPELIQGDLNCDGTVDALDALVLLLDLAGAPMEQPQGCPPLSEIADVNCDSVIDETDIEQLLRYAAGLTVQQAQPCTPIGQVI